MRKPHFFQYFDNSGQLFEGSTPSKTLADEK